MAMFDLKQSQPGVNPQLEELVARMLAGSGIAQQTQPGPSGLDGSISGPGGNAPVRGIQQTEPEAQPSQTLRVLVSRGVPPELAQHAIGNPPLLRQLLIALQQQGQPTMAAGGR
jgi:hypothetical protein